MNRRILPALALLVLCAAPPLPAQGPGDAIPRPRELQPDIDFWIRVYSQITTNEGFVHDNRYLDVVYETLRFAPNTPPKERQAVVDAAKDRYEDVLRRIAAHRRGASAAALTPEEQRVAALFGERTTADAYAAAADRVRFQLGQADRFFQGLVRSGAWEGHIAQTITNLGLPPELAALPHVESSFDASAYSKVGAAGLWQFMRSTGRRYLRIDDAVDERLDPFRSTEAAAQLLSYNYRLLGTWPLALTAYNHGAAGMRRAVKATGTTDFVTINRTHRSPSFGFASRNFYPSFLAALTIDQNPEKYFGPFERRSEARFHEVALPAYVRVDALEELVGVPRTDLRALNPGILPPAWSGERLLPRGYRLRLPSDQATWTTALLAQRLPLTEQYVAQVQSRSHTVRRGESLASIAKRYGLSTSELAGLNDLAPDAALRSGRALRLPERWPALVSGAPVPRPAVAAASVAGDGARADVYVVRRGDTLSTIAARMGATEAELLAQNRLRNPNFIFEGQRLRVSGTAPSGAPAPRSSDATPAVVVAEATPAPRSGPATRARAGGRAATATATPAATPTALVVAQADSPPTPAERESTEDAAAAARAAERAERDEPVTAQQADGAGSALTPGAEAPASMDLVDYSVAKDDTVRVEGAETLGHYAEWLGVSASRLRQLNQLKPGAPVLLGRTLKLDLSRTTPGEFEAQRRAYHLGLQANFFEEHRILGTEIYLARRGDSLWSISQRYASVPIWLLQQYNPDMDLADIRPGTPLVVPRVEVLASSNGTLAG